ncbi:MAG: DegV family protein [Lachnospiraceae bacterium]|nr:DegV family protein [Lachnospiraceae bacterium]
MSKVAIVTDSSSGITQSERKELGVYAVPMPFVIDGKEYLEDVNLTQEEFYTFLENGADVSTSQPSIESIKNVWDEVLSMDEYEELVYIPLSSGLSGSCQTAYMLAIDYDGKVCVVDNHRVSVTQRQSVIEAKQMADSGMSAEEIKEVLTDTALDANILIMVNTLKYLQKGGRVTPAGAALAGLLGIKPILQIYGEKLDAYAKARSVKNAKRIMTEGIIESLKESFPEDYEAGNYNIMMAYSHDRKLAEDFRDEIQDMFPDKDILINPLPLVISCHIGPDSLALVFTRKYL